MATACVRNTDTDSVSKAQEKLRNYMKDDGEDQNWKNRAVGCREEILCLIEETSGTRGLLELEKAIAGSNSETECVVITLSNTVYWPHVASYRLWRWPDLPGLINPIDMCNYEQDPSNFHLSSPHRQGQSICVNPYHYYYGSTDAVSTLNIKDRLLRYKKAGGDQLWIDHSMDCLNTVLDLTELESSRGLFNLEKAISTENPDTDCIFISIKPSDARLYIKGEKYLPHVVSYKLWRCPDLANSVAAVQPIMKYQTLRDYLHLKIRRRNPGIFCINPLHYEETPHAATIKCLKDYIPKSEDPRQNTTDCFEKIISFIDEDKFQKLENAIEIKEKKPTECIIIKHNLTIGTFKVNGQTYWPHVVSCRLWRWHGLENHTDKIQPRAEYEQSEYHHPKTRKPTSKGHPEFHMCINPFHYQKSPYSGHKPT